MTPIALNDRAPDAIVVRVQATDRDTLEYQPVTARHRRRVASRLAAIIVLALATGLAGKLCWDKFNGPIRRHLAVRSTQAAMLATPCPTTKTLAAAGAWLPGTDAQSLMIANYLGEPSFAAGTAQQTFWYGPLHTTSGGDRIVIIRATNLPLASLGPTVVMQVEVVRPATLFVPYRVLWTGYVLPPFPSRMAMNARVSPTHSDCVLVDFAIGPEPVVTFTSPPPPPPPTITCTLQLRPDDSVIAEPPPLSSFYSSTTGSN